MVPTPIPEFVELGPHGPNHKPAENPKQAHGNARAPLQYVPPIVGIVASLAFEEGAEKYGAFNWREAPVQYTTYIAAAQRHLMRMMDGEDTDPITGVDHWGSVIACMGILADARHCAMLIDDRPKPGPAPALLNWVEETRRQKETK